MSVTSISTGAKGPTQPGVSLSAEAYNQIRSMIVSLELEPGSLINEAELMSRLGFGRTPIREALRTLASEKLVDVYPRRGMFVTSVDVQNLSSISEVRAVLEIKAASLAAERSTPRDRAVTVALIAEIDAIKGEPNMTKLIQLDQRIHRHIYQCTHNQFLETTLEQYYGHALRIWFLALDHVENLSDAVIEHRALLKAISEHDSEAAAKAMQDHVEGFEGNIRRNL
ncbi:MAG: GntR family transcriptional regulator [Candidatus Nanopelagicaceae bacterium]|nr:GntR family transcriptional regulator [Candidatus Nanopelagicaceae bacterium]